MNPRREADRWWRQAQDDLTFLPVARQAGKYDICCFLAQQTAEFYSDNDARQAIAMAEATIALVAKLINQPETGDEVQDV